MTAFLNITCLLLAIMELSVSQERMVKKKSPALQKHDFKQSSSIRQEEKKKEREKKKPGNFNYRLRKCHMGELKFDV